MLRKKNNKTFLIKKKKLGLKSFFFTETDAKWNTIHFTNTGYICTKFCVHIPNLSIYIHLTLKLNIVPIIKILSLLQDLLSDAWTSCVHTFRNFELGTFSGKYLSVWVPKLQLTSDNSSVIYDRNYVQRVLIFWGSS